VSCDNLICAHCSGPVEQGGCSVCRAARQHLHAEGFSLPAGPVLAIAIVLTVLLLLLMH